MTRPTRDEFLKRWDYRTIDHAVGVLIADAIYGDATATVPPPPEALEEAVAKLRGEPQNAAGAHRGRLDAEDWAQRAERERRALKEALDALARIILQKTSDSFGYVVDQLPAALERRIAASVAEEREACVQACKGVREGFRIGGPEDATANLCIDAIRARGTP